VTVLSEKDEEPVNIDLFRQHAHTLFVNSVWALVTQNTI